MIKKITTIFLAGLFMLASTLPVFAAQPDTMDKEKISKMFESATMEYQKEVKEGKKPDVRYANVTSSTGEKFLIKAFRYKDPNEKLEKNQYTKTYVYSTDEQYVQPATQDWKPMMTAFLDTSKSKWDVSGSVLGTITLTYENPLGSDDYLLTRVSGGWAIYQTGIQVLNRSVTAACFDPGSYGEQYVTWPISTMTFNTTTSFSNYVNDGALGSVLGASTRGTVTRGTSSWLIEFNNTLFNNSIDFTWPTTK